MKIKCPGDIVYENESYVYFVLDKKVFRARKKNNNGGAVGRKNWIVKESVVERDLFWFKRIVSTGINSNDKLCDALKCFFKEEVVK